MEEKKSLQYITSTVLYNILSNINWTQTVRFYLQKIQLPTSEFVVRVIVRAVWRNKFKVILLETKQIDGDNGMK